MRQAVPALPVQLRRAQWTGAGQLLGTNQRVQRPVCPQGRRPVSRDSSSPGVGASVDGFRMESHWSCTGLGVGLGEEQPGTMEP